MRIALGSMTVLFRKPLFSSQCLYRILMHFCCYFFMISANLNGDGTVSRLKI